MTTSLYRAGNTYVSRTNYVPNPSFEDEVDGAAGVIYGSEFETVGVTRFEPAVLAGIRALSTIVSDTPTNFTSLGQGIEPVAAGDWVAARIPIRSSGWTGRAAVRFIFYDAGGAQISSSAYGNAVPLSSGTYAFAMAVSQAPAGTVRSNVYAYLYGPASNTPPSGVTTHSDAWIVAVTDTEGEALAAVNTYFDGDTEPNPLTGAVYEWTDEPNASPSVELLPAGLVTPTLVLNYEDERPTGVQAFQTITNDRPVIVRRARRPFPTGTLEMLCASLQLAEQVAAVCDGTTDVTLLSDDVPDAPWTFAPVDAARVTWNTPYDSWTVRVPYVRLT
jgi:hypothetical protein